MDKVKLKYNKKIWKPKKDRWDIYNNLPKGAITKIAKECNTHIPYVSMILHGKKSDQWRVIEKAELLAAINIWKIRFCKYKSQL